MSHRMPADDRLRPALAVFKFFDSITGKRRFRFSTGCAPRYFRTLLFDNPF